MTVLNGVLLSEIIYSLHFSLKVSTPVLLLLLLYHIGKGSIVLNTRYNTQRSTNCCMDEMFGDIESAFVNPGWFRHLLGLNFKACISGLVFFFPLAVKR